MILIVIFWVILLIWAINGFAGFIAGPAQHIMLLVMLFIIGYKLFGNPIN